MKPRFSALAYPFVGAAVLALIIILVRLTFDARAALAVGDARRDAGTELEAITHYFDAARAAYPGNPYAALALQRLWLMSKPPAANAEAADVDASTSEVERKALEAFRAAVLATRSVYVPRRADLQTANERLAEIYAKWELRNARGAPPTLEQRRQWHLQKLIPIPGPKLLWVGVALAGLVVWFGAVVAFILKALTPAMKLKRGPALGAGLAFMCGFGLFLLGLSQ